MISSKSDYHTVDVSVSLQSQSFQCFFSGCNKNRQSDHQNIYVCVLYKYKGLQVYDTKILVQLKINSVIETSIQKRWKSTVPPAARDFLPLKTQLIPAVLYRNKTIKYITIYKTFVQSTLCEIQTEVPPVPGNQPQKRGTPLSLIQNIWVLPKWPIGL